jgi:hypothetical protein
MLGRSARRLRRTDSEEAGRRWKWVSTRRTTPSSTVAWPSGSGLTGFRPGPVLREMESRWRQYTLVTEWRHPRAHEAQGPLLRHDDFLRFTGACVVIVKEKSIPRLLSKCHGRPNGLPLPDS